MLGTGIRPPLPFRTLSDGCSGDTLLSLLCKEKEAAEKDDYWIGAEGSMFMFSKW